MNILNSQTMEINILASSIIIIDACEVVLVTGIIYLINSLSDHTEKSNIQYYSELFLLSSVESIVISALFWFYQNIPYVSNTEYLYPAFFTGYF